MYTTYFTEEAKIYQPTDSDIFIHAKDGKYQRMIFSAPLVLKNEEEKEMEKFRTYMLNKK